MVQKLEKSLGLDPQLSWLTTVCLRGFVRNVPQLFFVFSLHLCLQRAVKNELKQISISNHHNRVHTVGTRGRAMVIISCDSAQYIGTIIHTCDTTYNLP